jgi:hypothetical protein
VIAAIVQLTELVIQKTSPLLHQVLGIYLPLITTNCAVLGVPLLNAAPSQPARSRCCSASARRAGFTLALCCSPASASASTAPTFRYAFAARHRHDHRRPHEPRLHGLRRPGLESP